MPKLNLNARVGAVSGKNEETKTIEIFGYGVYKGPIIPPRGIFFLGIEFALLQRRTPKIELDNGKVVWGCECYWGPEKEVQAGIALLGQEGWKVVVVDIEEERKKREAAPPSPPAPDDHKLLTTEQALSVLPEGENIHTFVNGPRTLLGCDWGMETITKLIEENGAEISGEMARSMKHGLVVFRAPNNEDPLFIETNMDKLTALRETWGEKEKAE